MCKCTCKRNTIKVGSIVNYVEDGVAEFSVFVTAVTAVTADRKFFSGYVIASKIPDYSVGYFYDMWDYTLSDFDSTEWVTYKNNKILKQKKPLLGC